MTCNQATKLQKRNQHSRVITLMTLPAISSFPFKLWAAFACSIRANWQDKHQIRK